MVKSLVKTVVYWGAGDTAAAEVGGWLAGWLAGCVCVGVWEALRRAGTPAEHRWARDSNPDVLRCRRPRQRVRWCTPLMSSWSWAAPNPPPQVMVWQGWAGGPAARGCVSGPDGGPSASVAAAIADAALEQNIFCHRCCCCCCRRLPMLCLLLVFFTVCPKVGNLCMISCQPSNVGFLSCCPLQFRPRARTSAR